MNYCPNCGFCLSKMTTDTSSEIGTSKIPSSEPVGTQNEEKKSILDEYFVPETKTGIEIAQPILLDNRMRLHMLATRPTPMVQPKRLDSELDSFSYHGEKLFFGEGLEQTY